MAEPKHPLSIKIIGVKNLPEVEGEEGEDGEMKEYGIDTHCKVSLGLMNSQVTAVVKQTGSAVNWNETFLFDATGLWHSDITVAVHQRWKAGIKKCLGEVKIRLDHHKDVPIDMAMDHWYPFGLGGGKKKNLKKKPSLKSGNKDTQIGQPEIGIVLGYDEDSPMPGVDEDEVFVATQKKKAQAKNKKIVRGLDDLEDESADQVWDMANEQAKENEKIVESSKQVLAATSEVATETLVNLDRQSEQMRHMEKDLDAIDADVTQAHRKLRSIECIFCCCFNCCTHGKNKKKTKAMKAAAEERKLERQQFQQDKDDLDAQMARERRMKRGKAQHAVTAEGDMEGLTSEEQFSKRKDNIDAGLDDIAEMVSDLKDQAASIHDQVVDDNLYLDELDMKTEHMDKRVENVTQRVVRAT